MVRWAFVSLIFAAIFAGFILAGLTDGHSDPSRTYFFIFLGVVSLALIACLVGGDQLPP